MRSITVLQNVYIQLELSMKEAVSFSRIADFQYPTKAFTVHNLTTVPPHS